MGNTEDEMMEAVVPAAGKKDGILDNSRHCYFEGMGWMLL